jgi:tetratricopeptide (TPR) repeat protein
VTIGSALDERTRTLLLAAAIALLAVAAYVPALSAGFIWDDDYYVTDNLTLRSLDGLVRIWTETDANPQYYPLTFTSLWIGYQLHGVEPFGHHLVNVLLHAVSAILAFRLLRLLGVPGAWLAAAVFAVHPVHVESVAWVTERKNTLCAVFSFAASLAFLRWALTAPLSSERAARRASPYVAFGLFLAALLSKTACAPLPLALAAVVLWKRGTIPRRSAAWLFAMLVVAAIFGSMTAVIETKQVGAQGAAFSASFPERTLLAGQAVWMYLSKVWWPRDLMFVYPRPTASLSDPASYVLPLAALGALGALWALRSRIGGGPLTAAVYYVLLLSPALGFFNVFPMQYSYVMDHFQYLATIGAIALGVGALASLPVPWPVARALFAALLLAVLAVLTFRQCGIYRDEETLWRDTIARNPSAWLAHYNLGKLLERRGELDEAALRYRDAMAANPAQHDVLMNLANILAGKGNLAEAIPLYRKVVELAPGQPFARYNLGLALETTGDREGAIAEYRAVLAILPDPAKLTSEFEASLFRGGGFATLLEKTRARLDGLAGGAAPPAPGAPGAVPGVDALVREGNALADRGRIADAIDRYTRALALDPRHALAHYNLALAEEARGDDTSALAHYEAAIESAPAFAGAHNNLAILLYRRGDYAGAWREVRLVRTHGMSPSDEFVRALAEKLPEPRE